MWKPIPYNQLVEVFIQCPGEQSVVGISWAPLTWPGFHLQFPPTPKGPDLPESGKNKQGSAMVWVNLASSRYKGRVFEELVETAQREKYYQYISGF